VYLLRALSQSVGAGALIQCPDDFISYFRNPPDVLIDGLHAYPEEPVTPELVAHKLNPGTSDGLPDRKWSARKSGHD
jgi:hypothetical protein